jgi:hypothetical protein
LNIVQEKENSMICPTALAIHGHHLKEEILVN